MYLRFISPFRSRWKNVDYGIFQAAFKCRDEELIPNYLLDQLFTQVDWFKRYLPSPDERHFQYRGGKPTGICWFKSDAKAMIRRARHMADIMQAGDVFITETKTKKPGHILYRDDFQIIAKPNQSTPTKWG